MSTSFTAQATNGSGQNQGAAQVVVADSTTITGTVPAGNGTAYTIIPTAGLAPGSAWRWSYVQFSFTGVREAFAWGQFTKDVNGTVAATILPTVTANPPGVGTGTTAAQQLVTTGGTVTPASIAYAANAVNLTTNAANTAGPNPPANPLGHPWTVTLTRWA